MWIPKFRQVIVTQFSPIQSKWVDVYSDAGSTARTHTHTHKDTKQNKEQTQQQEEIKNVTAVLEQKP
jgi:hypothetical protein